MTSKVGKFFRRGLCALLGHKSRLYDYDRIVQSSTGYVIYVDKMQCERCKLCWREAEVYGRGRQLP